jgi:transposase-like protein
MAEDGNSTNSLWLTREQIVGRILQQPEMSPDEAKEFYDDPANRKIVDWTVGVLAAVLFLDIYDAGLPIAAVRVLCGSHYVDLVTWLRWPDSRAPGVLDQLRHDLAKRIRESDDIFYNLRWAKRTPWPVPPTASTTSAATPPSALERAKAAITANPGKSKRQIAREIGVDERWVRKAHNELTPESAESVPESAESAPESVESAESAPESAESAPESAESAPESAPAAGPRIHIGNVHPATAEAIKHQQVQEMWGGPMCAGITGPRGGRADT